MVALAVMAAATRVPLLGRSLGEADCARYLLGLARWLAGGGTSVGIYAKVLSPGYYGLAAWAVRHSQWTALSLLNGWSVAAAVATAPLLYLCGLRLERPAVAATAAIVLLLAPGFWWLGIEPHPQGPAFLCLLLGLLCFLQAWRPQRGRARRHPAPGWMLAAVAALGAGLLLKYDVVLQLPLLPALAWSRVPGPQQGSLRRQAVGWSVAMAMAAGAIFLIGRRLLLGAGYVAIEAATFRAVAEFWFLPRGVDLLKQVLPMVTSPGAATAAVMVAGLVLGVRLARWRRLWLWPLLALVPGLLFWSLLRGNNARHMASLLLVPLWASLDGWAQQWQLSGGSRCVPARLATLCALALGLNLALIPPSSNTTLYPSANVPASQRLLAQRLQQMHLWVDDALGGPSPPRCLVGNYTLPYLQLERIGEGPNRLLGPLPAAGQVPRAPLEPIEPVARAGYVGAGPTAFLEVNSRAEYQQAALRCGRLASLEYDARGVHRQFFGQEWAWIPWRRRWYPARPALVP